MQRPSPWLMLVVLLVGIVLVREPRFAAAEELFLGWLIRYSEASGPPVPLTVVELGTDSLAAKPASAPEPSNAPSDPISPLEFALYLQSLLDFQPGVAAFENVLKWRERDKDQEQVFLDQAMRVPKLLLAAELGQNPDPDAPWAEIAGFTQVSGKSGNLAAFSGVTRQPNEDLRLISTLGYVNLPDEFSSRIRVPLLFLHRGKVIPSFALQAILLWEKVTLEEVKIVFGATSWLRPPESFIDLPRGRRIPIREDGTMIIHPNTAQRTRHLALNELLLAAQERESEKGSEFADLQGQIVLARTPNNPLSPPNRFAATIATIQANRFLERVTPFFDYAILMLIAAVAGWLHKIERFDLVLYGIAATAAYCLIALGTIARWNIWLPGILPLSALWLAIVLAPFFRKKEAYITIPPPVV